MKKFLLATLSFVLPFFFFSCGEGENGGKGNSVLYWASNNSDEITYARLVVDKFNKDNPGSHIAYQPVPEGQSSEEVILAAVVGNTTPDLYSNMWQGDVQLYADAGKLVPLDTLPGFMEFIKARCDSDVIKEVTAVDGHIYQVPWKINPIMQIYNSKMFASVGWNKPPKTYSEYFAAAEKIKQQGYDNGYYTRWIGYSEVIVTWWQRLFDFYPLYLAASGGAKLIDNNKVAFNNKYAVETMRFMKALYDSTFFPREKLSARQDPFLAGYIATRFTGPWEIVHAEKFKPEGFEYSFAPLPVPDGWDKPVYTYGDTKNIVMFNTCKNKLLAWQFLKTIIDARGDYLLLKTTNQLPRRKDLTTNPLFADYFNNHPKIKPFAEQSKYVRGPDSSPVLKEIFDAISQQYEACVVYGKKTPEQAIQDAAKAAEIILLQ